MKIRKIKLENHTVLGTIDFDFTDKQGKVIDNIIIAGENGTGKTVLLNLIYQFCNYSLESKKRDEKRFIEIELSDDEVKLLYENVNLKLYFTEPLSNNIFQLFFDFSIIHNWDQVKIKINSFYGEKTIGGEIFAQESKILRSIFSDAEINYSPNQIHNVTSKDIDSLEYISKKSSKELATEITQLLIDIEALDSQDFANWGKLNVGMPVDASKLNNRMKRFTDAFSYMFPHKKFKHIVNTNNVKSLVFEENGNEMPIENLSSGEKQIVFRGSFLLKDKIRNSGAIILIDEPEISLHPTWQIKILNFYKRLFINNNLQDSQLIIATHSPFIIHNNARNNDKVIILKKGDDNKIYIPKVLTFQNWTEEKIVKSAFNIDFLISTDKIIILLEGETDEKYFRKVQEIFDDVPSNFEFNWIGRVKENGRIEFTGKSALDQTKNLLTANPYFLIGKVVLLYDVDTKKSNENFGNLFIQTINENKKNFVYRIGIENLLELSDAFDYSKFYNKIEKTDEYGGSHYNEELDKTSLCNHICDNLAVEQQKSILINLYNEVMNCNKIIKEYS